VHRREPLIHSSGRSAIMLSTFGRRSGSSKSRSPARSRLRARCPRVRPGIECLEDRALLSVCLVDRLTDVGGGREVVGDLRYCIEQTQDQDSIQFAVQGTINLTRALPDLTRSVSIEGPGPELMTVRGQGTAGRYRIFTVTTEATVSIAGLTVSNGVSSNGG